RPPRQTGAPPRHRQRVRGSLSLDRRARGKRRRALDVQRPRRRAGRPRPPRRAVSVAALNGVTKRFGRVTALADAGFSVEAGEVVALLGANGAGKSTALGLLLGLRCPDAGEARLFGLDPRRPA